MSGLEFVNFLINTLIVLIIIEAVITNIIAFGGKISPRHPLVVWLRRIVNPILNPVRRVLPPRLLGGWDLSPLIVILLLNALQHFLSSR